MEMENSELQKIIKREISKDTPDYAKITEIATLAFEWQKNIPFRICATATPAPNDIYEYQVNNEN